MTTPDECTRAVLQTRAFREALCSPTRALVVPQLVRREAERLPDAGHLDRAAVAWPDTWAPASARHKDGPLYLELLEQSRRSKKR